MKKKIIRITNKQLNEYIDKKVNEIMLDETEAGEKAKKMGLKHVGWGRYADKTGKVVAQSKDGKLVKVKGDSGKKEKSKAGNAEKIHQLKNDFILYDDLKIDLEDKLKDRENFDSKDDWERARMNVKRLSKKVQNINRKLKKSGNSF